MKKLLPLLVLVACKGGHNAITDVGSFVDPDVSTVIHVTWTSGFPGEGDSWVEYGPTADLGSETPHLAGVTGHDVELYGAAPLSTVYFKVHTAVDGDDDATADGTQDADNTPAELPDLSLELDGAGQIDDSPQYLLGCMFSNNQSLSFVVNRAGQYVWYHLAPPIDDGSGTLYPVENIEALFTPEDDNPPSILVNSFALARTVDLGRITRITFGGDVGEELITPGAHHMFTALADGTLAWLAVDVRDWQDPAFDNETVSVVGDQVVVRAPDGTESVLFSTWDHLVPAHYDGWDGAFYPQGHDWTHANALKYYPQTDTWLVSFANPAMFAELDHDGKPIRWFGAAAAGNLDGLTPIVAAEGSLEWSNQHDPNLVYDASGNLTGVTMFATDDRAAQSGGVEYTIDDATHTATQVWSGGFDQNLRNAFLGQTIPLADGDTIVNFAGRGVVQELAPDGTPVWDLRTRGIFLAQVHPFDDFYTPTITGE